MLTHTHTHIIIGEKLQNSLTLFPQNSKPNDEDGGTYYIGHLLLAEGHVADIS